MTPGLGFESKSALIDEITASASFSANYPMTNLKDIVVPSQVARAAATGSVTVFLRWPAQTPIQAVTLINHNGTAGCSAACSLWSGIDGGGAFTGLLAQKTVAVPAAVPGYPQVLPIVFDGPFNTRGVSVALSGNALAWELGAIDASLWWELPGISPGYEFGVDDRAERNDYVGGAQSDDDAWAPRIFSGQIDLLDMKVAASTGLNFQTTQGKQKPFVFVKDLSDPTTWPRTAMQARNTEVPPTVGALYRHDKFQLRFTEHWR